MDRLDELHVFLAIFDAGGMAAAARKLRRSPPAVTRILGVLEQRLGARLFERSTRSLTPTEAGQRFALQARHVLAEYEAAVEAHSQAPLRGMLRIAAPVVFGRRHVTPLVTRFLARYPDISADLVLADRNADLIEEGIDVAVRIGPLPDSSLVARKVGQVRRLAVASPAYLKRRGTPARPADLAGHDIILSTTIRPLPEWRFRHKGRDVAVRFTPRLQLNDVEAMLNTARAGFGIARVLSYQVAEDLKKRKLVRLLADYEPAPVPVHLVLPSARLMPGRLRAFVDFAAAELGALDVLAM
ncbi:MAG TPA: LysR family transcriptional regulator [Telluria sp.]|nr:LysR family transcriptional regulator [Telluria sp.]